MFDFDDSLFAPPGPSKIILTRTQKREGRRKYRVTEDDSCTQPNTLNITSEELRKLQDSDESLHHVCTVADGKPNAAAGEKFFRQDGLLYRRFYPPGIDDEEYSIKQLVLPSMPSCRAPTCTQHSNVRTSWQAVHLSDLRLRHSLPRGCCTTNNRRKPVAEELLKFFARVGIPEELPIRVLISHPSSWPKSTGFYR